MDKNVLPQTSIFANSTLRIVLWASYIFFIQPVKSGTVSEGLHPYRAYYTISMSSKSPIHSDVVDIRGTMMVEYNKVDGGWTVQHLTEVWKYFPDDSSEHTRWGHTIFETEDDSLLKFRTFRKVNDVVEEDIAGVARRQRECIQVTYKQPEPKTMTLSSTVLFPIQHLKGVLSAAESEDHLYPRHVFDGSSVEGPCEMDTFIGAKKTYSVADEESEMNPFEGQPYWPVRFSIYGLGKQNYEPEYVITQNLLPNGIFTQYTLNDGNVKIHGVLERVELLSAE